MWSRPPCATERPSSTRAAVTSVVSRIGIARRAAGTARTASTPRLPPGTGESASPARTTPRNRAPESPMKIFDGGKLWTRNPPVAPASASANRASSTRPSARKIAPRKMAPMTAIPPASPSMLSSRLSAFVIPTNQKIESVTSRANTPVSRSITPLAISTTAATSWGRSFAAGARARRSSASPVTNMTNPASTIASSADQPPQGGMPSPSRATAPRLSAIPIPAATAKPPKIASPPRRGVGLRLQRSSRTGSTTAWLNAKLRMSGVRTTATTNAAAPRRSVNRTGFPIQPLQVVRPGCAGPPRPDRSSRPLPARGTNP